MMNANQILNALQNSEKRAQTPKKCYFRGKTAYSRRIYCLDCY